MRNLRCLTIHQPWASAIVHGNKRIENRTQAPPTSLIGQWLGLHAGRKYDYNGELILESHFGWNPASHPKVEGAIVGICRVIGWVSPHGGQVAAANGWATSQQLATYRQDPFYAGEVGWVLTDVLALPTPVPCRGMQGVWWADQAAVAAVAAQLGREVAHA